MNITFKELYNNINQDDDFECLTPFRVLHHCEINFNAIQYDYEDRLLPIFREYGLSEEFKQFYMGDLIEDNNELTTEIFDLLQELSTLVIDDVIWDIDDLIYSLKVEYDIESERNRREWEEGQRDIERWFDSQRI